MAGRAARIRHFHGSGLPVSSIIVEIWFRKGKDHFVRSSVYSDNPDCCIGVFSAEKTGAISTDEIAVVFQWGIPPVFIALLIISVLISQKIFEKKEF